MKGRTDAHRGESSPPSKLAGSAPGRGTAGMSTGCPRTTFSFNLTMNSGSGRPAWPTDRGDRANKEGAGEWKTELRM